MSSMECRICRKDGLSCQCQTPQLIPAQSLGYTVVSPEDIGKLHHDQINAAYAAGIQKCLDLQVKQIAADEGDDWLKNKMEALLKELYC